MRIVYCIVPRRLAAELHEPLREFFRDDPRVEVVIERRGGERRRAARRQAQQTGATGRRAVRNVEGRRVADRRLRTQLVPVPALPPAAAPHAAALTFVERDQPASRKAEDDESARLVIQAQQEDGEAVAELYLLYYEPLYGYLRLLLKDSHEAEDVVQEVFEQLIGILPSYDIRAEQPVRVLLYRIARNRSIDHLRKSTRTDIEVPSEIERRHEAGATPGEMLERLSDSELAIYLRRLPESQLHVLLLRYMLDFTPQEIAGVLDTSADGARALQYRALQQLRKTMRRGEG